MTNYDIYFIFIIRYRNAHRNIVYYVYTIVLGNPIASRSRKEKDHFFHLGSC